MAGGRPGHETVGSECASKVLTDTAEENDTLASEMLCTEERRLRVVWQAFI